MYFQFCLFELTLSIDGCIQFSILMYSMVRTSPVEHGAINYTIFFQKTSVRNHFQKYTNLARTGSSEHVRFSRLFAKTHEPCSYELSFARTEHFTKSVHSYVNR